MGSFLDAQSSEFDERNLFLFLSLGLLSVGDKLEALLRVHAPASVDDGVKRSEAELEPLAYLALGAIRIRDVIRRELHAASVRPCPSEEFPRPDDSSGSVRDVLR